MNKPIIVQEDPWLEPYSEIIKLRYEAALRRKEEFINASGSLKNFASGFLYYGLHKTKDGWIIREWAPNFAWLRRDKCLQAGDITHYPCP